MKNTDLFYSLAKEYQDKRGQVMQSFENRSEQLSQMRGSRYFDTEMTKATNEKDAALTSLKREYSERFGAVLSSMDKANRQRKLTPPTEEELRLISLLKMKDKLTEQELDAAANMLKGNSTCLAVLTEIAHKQGYLRGYMNCSDNAEMPAESVKTLIDSLNSSVRDFMEFDTSRAARTARKYHERLYGVSENAPELPKRALFNTKDECFRELSGLSDKNLEAFCNAVDAE